MKNIIKEISRLEEEKKSLLKVANKEDLILEYDAQINDYIFNVAEYLTIPLSKLGPYYAILETITTKKEYKYHEKEDSIYHYCYLESDNDKILILKTPKEEYHNKVSVYNITIVPTMLTLSLDYLKTRPVIKEFTDEYITYQMLHKKDLVNTETVFDIFIQESTELQKVRKNNQ